MIFSQWHKWQCRLGLLESICKLDCFSNHLCSSVFPCPASQDGLRLRVISWNVAAVNNNPFECLCSTLQVNVETPLETMYNDFGGKWGLPKSWWHHIPKPLKSLNDYTGNGHAAVSFLCSLWLYLMEMDELTEIDTKFNRKQWLRLDSYQFCVFSSSHQSEMVRLKNCQKGKMDVNMELVLAITSV